MGVGGADRLVIQLQVPDSSDVVLARFLRTAVSDRGAQVEQVSLLGSRLGVWNGSGSLSGEGSLRRGPPTSPNRGGLHFLTFSKGISAPKTTGMLRWPPARGGSASRVKFQCRFTGSSRLLRVKIWFGEFKGRESTGDNLATVRRTAPAGEGGGRREEGTGRKGSGSRRWALPCAAPAARSWAPGPRLPGVRTGRRPAGRIAAPSSPRSGPELSPPHTES